MTRPPSEAVDLCSGNGSADAQHCVSPPSTGGMVWPGAQDVSAAFAARDIAFRALVFVGGERSQHFGLLALRDVGEV